MRTDLTIANADASWCSFVRQDTVYVRYEAVYQARTAFGKVVHLILYLLPGIITFFSINIESVYWAQLTVTRLTARFLQYAWVLLIRFGWHMFVPCVALRFVDKPSLAERFATLDLDRRGISLVLPVNFVPLALISLPYVESVVPVIESSIRSVPLFRTADYGIFQDTSQTAYQLSRRVAVVRSEDVHDRVSLSNTTRESE